MNATPDRGVRDWRGAVQYCRTGGAEMTATEPRKRKPLISDDRWRELTKHYPGLEKQPCGIVSWARDVAERGRGKQRSAARETAGRRREAYDSAAKALADAYEATVAALDLWASPFEVQREEDGTNFFRIFLAQMKTIEGRFMLASVNIVNDKRGPRNDVLRRFVCGVACWFKDNGLADRISGGENSHSIKVFIKALFKEFDFIVPDRALSDAIRSYSKKRE